MSSTLVYQVGTVGKVSEAEHARRVRRIAMAPRWQTRWVRCRHCGLERKVGTPCGEPCS